MQYEISPGRSQLHLFLDEAEKAEVQKLEDAEEKENLVKEFLAQMLSNSELEWVFPEETGDITEAPLFGILGKESPEKKGPYGVRHCGHWDNTDQYQPILERWGYTSYQVKDPWEEIIKEEKITFSNGEKEKTSPEESSSKLPKEEASRIAQENAARLRDING